MVDLTIFQMAQATLEDKEVLGHDRECCPNTNQCSDNNLLFGCHHPSRYEVETFNLWGLADSQHLINGQNLLERSIR